ncbi:hypothetical protein LCGC14_1046020, partial [marine sediment metagenome]
APISESGSGSTGSGVKAHECPEWGGAMIASESQRACSETVPPWVENPYRPISLGELMNRFQAQWFIALAARLGKAQVAGQIYPATELTPSERKESIDAFATWMPHLAGLGFIAPAKAVSRWMTRLADGEPITFSEYGRWAEDMETRLVEAAEDVLFLALSANETALVTAYRPFGEGVASNFPSAAYDIAEAGQCLALHRSTGCVFHLMRVMEYGLRAVGKSLNDPKLVAAHNPTWGRILTRCKQELEKQKSKRSPEWKKHDVFYSGAYAHLLGVKEAWRNPTMHIASKYTEEEAQDIWSHVKAFMAHLAAKLAE